MKKSKVIRLVLVASVMASCSSHDDYTAADSRLHIRGDSTSQYTHTQGNYGGGGYYHFIPFGIYAMSRGYYHGGYASPGFSSRASGTSVSRGGFGSSGVRVGG